MNKKIALYIRMMSMIGIFYSDVCASQRSQASVVVEFVDLKKDLTMKACGTSPIADITKLQLEVQALIQKNNECNENLQKRSQQNNASMDRLADEEEKYDMIKMVEEYKKNPETVYYHKTIDLSEKGRQSLFTFIQAGAALKKTQNPDDVAYWMPIYKQSNNLVEQDIMSKFNDFMVKSSTEIIKLLEDGRRNESAQLIIDQDRMELLDIATLLSNTREDLSMQSWQQLVSKKIKHDKQKDAAIVMQAFVRKIIAQNKVAVIKKFNRIEHERIYSDMMQVVETMVDDVFEQIVLQEQATMHKIQLEKKEAQRQIDKEKHALKIAAEKEAALEKKATAKKQAAQQSENAKAKLAIKKSAPLKVLKKEAEEDALLAACMLENEKIKKYQTVAISAHVVPEQKISGAIQEDVESLMSAAVFRRHIFTDLESSCLGNVERIFYAMNEYDVQNKVFSYEKSGALNLVYQLKDLLSLEQEYHINLYQYFWLAAIAIDKKLQTQGSNLSVYFVNEAAIHNDIRDRIAIIIIQLNGASAVDITSKYKKLKDFSSAMRTQLSDLVAQKIIINNEIVQEITALHRDEDIKLIAWEKEIAQAEKSNEKLCALQDKIDKIQNVLMQFDQKIQAQNIQVKQSIALSQLMDIQKLIQQKSSIKSASIVEKIIPSVNTVGNYTSEHFELLYEKAEKRIADALRSKFHIDSSIIVLLLTDFIQGSELDNENSEQLIKCISGSIIECSKMLSSANLTLKLKQDIFEAVVEENNKIDVAILADFAKYQCLLLDILIKHKEALTKEHEKAKVVR